MFEDLSILIIGTTAGTTVLNYHESAPISILETAQSDTLPSRKFTNFNPIIPDDEFMSPPRDYEHMDNWLYRPHDGSISPISSDSSSIGYISGSDWTTDSSWMSYDSLVPERHKLSKSSEMVFNHNLNRDDHLGNHLNN